MEINEWIERKISGNEWIDEKMSGNEWIDGKKEKYDKEKNGMCRGGNREKRRLNKYEVEKNGKEWKRIVKNGKECKGVERSEKKKAWKGGEWSEMGLKGVERSGKEWKVVE